VPAAPQPGLWLRIRLARRRSQAIGWNRSCAQSFVLVGVGGQAPEARGRTCSLTRFREGKAIVYSSHILDVVERVCDRVIIIDQGTGRADDRHSRIPPHPFPTIVLL
jgi:hypothetical protein